ncbi:glucuronate isomerase [Solibacillus isronensis]|uniref:glucuronate isomerase n=1 Tax=Solibacillus isronensis TaxID=412383 RepID=UPI00203E756F|nr:glucuronate isomerase [Solibacillus isronensis]MCM3722226.1 glucuronate isomerase [Solibacillus isronensis]
MTKTFLGDSFLLNNKVAEKLYFDYAKDLPIIDYHCHLSPQEIYEDKQFKNITEAWLYGDHYKWRAMRANGVPEHLVTGDAADYERFEAWAKTVPYTIGNPLYQWTHLELRRFFNEETLLNEKTARAIWDNVNEQLPQKTARQLIIDSKVEVICTTDDPIDSLEYHIALQKDEQFNVKVLPSFRPDKALEINKPTFADWIGSLSEVVGETIESYEQLKEALAKRIQFFDEVGGKVSDHALDTIYYAEATEQEVSAIFEKGLAGGQVSLEDEAKYKTALLIFLGKQYALYNWAMQYHISAHRNNNTRQFNELGPDTGYDSINDGPIAVPLTRLLDALALEDALPKTIIYSLNPKDYYVIASIIGSFQEKVPGKIQFGTAWWFNDQKEGMLDQMKALASIGVFSRFIGMLTDSRSFLSYTRHEYFRRLVCDLIGGWVENGEFPEDYELLGKVVQDICYYNAKNYFNF